ncbi:MAG: glucose-6-phosphate isomerase [Phycisphaeraceae bacterium]|nr:glucose-6-phosphate isomerase [Phycisphaeraceae bacterium]
MLTIEYANCLSDRVGDHGIDPGRFGAGSEAARVARACTERLAKTRGTGWERWRNLARDPMRGEHLAAVRVIADECRGKYENLVVLGIGGSALGNIALQAALNPPTYNLLDDADRAGPRLFVLDNVDPMHVDAVLDACERLGGASGTLFNVVSKSGETAETAAQFMVIRDRLRQRLGDEAGEHIVAITDPAKGTMRAICDREGYRTLPVPDGVGGRFSVLSPVGLFSAAMCGIDIEALLDGADAMDKRCSEVELGKNPAAMLATLLVELGTRGGRGGQAKPNHVLMPYSNGLYLLADWFRQLWAESLGKRVDTAGREVFAGFTPIKALGATDQHSQVQLYREGPNDKVFGLMEVGDFTTGAWGRDVAIPTGLGVEATAYLEGRTLGALLSAEKRATEYALVESLRPNFTIRWPRIDARTVGEFVMLWQVATAYAGLMLNVDAYDQPAVETGKRATFGLMGRAGFEEWKQKVDGALGGGGRVV